MRKSRNGWVGVAGTPPEVVVWRPYIDSAELVLSAVDRPSLPTDVLFTSTPGIRHCRASTTDQQLRLGFSGPTHRTSAATRLAWFWNKS